MTALACFHCGFSGDAQWLCPENQNQQFCCAACIAAHQFVLDLGLDQYYQFQQAAAEQANTAQQVDYAWDSAAFKTDYCQQRGDEIELKLQLQGLHCPACAWLIERYLLGVEGISYSRVRLDQASLMLKLCLDKLLLSDVVSGINRLGYRLQPYNLEQQDLQWQNQQAAMLKQLAMSGIICMQLMMLAYALYQHPQHNYAQLLRWASCLLGSILFVYVVQHFVRRALSDIKNSWRNTSLLYLSMDVPIALAMVVVYVSSLLATLLGNGEIYFESLAMFCFFLLISRYIQSRSQHRINEVEQNWRQLLPLHITRCNGDEEETVACRDLQVGELIRLPVSVCCPCDGEVVQGCSSADQSFVNGEFVAQVKNIGDQVFAGSINIEAPLLIKVTATGDNRKIAHIHQLLEKTLSQKAPVVELSQRLASYVVLLVLLAASITAFYWWQAGSSQWLQAAVAVLVITCPCALSLAIPTALTCAMVRLKELGVLIKNVVTLQTMTKVTSVYFDKTGTLTQGCYQLVRTEVFGGYSSPQCEQIAAAILSQSHHPVASAFNKVSFSSKLTSSQNYPGQGSCGELCGDSAVSGNYRLGNAKFVGASAYASAYAAISEYSLLYLAKDNDILACFYLRDSLHPHTAQTISWLQKNALATRIVSGDHYHSVAKLAEYLGVDKFSADCNPQQKYQLLQQQSGVMMVGDGINDLPSLAAADVSVAVVNQHRQTLMAQGDVVLTRSGITALPDLWRIAQKTRSILRQNLVWAGLYNLLAIPCAMAGWVAPWMAVIGMSASSILVLLNSLRLLKE